MENEEILSSFIVVFVGLGAVVGGFFVGTFMGVTKEQSEVRCAEYADIECPGTDHDAAMCYWSRYTTCRGR